MKLKEVLDKTTAFFRDKKIGTPRLDAELLFSFSLKMDRIQLYMKFDQPLAETELAKLRELVRRRAQGERHRHLAGLSRHARAAGRGEAQGSRQAEVPRRGR